MHDLPKPLQVYIVEASAIIRRLLASTVNEAGGHVIGSSAEAPTAIADLSTLEPDVIFIDLSLKSGSGFDVLEALQSRQSRRSAIKAVLTNHASARFRSLSFGMGANGFFDKGSQISEVLALIHALATEKRTRGWSALAAGSGHPIQESDRRK